LEAKAHRPRPRRHEALPALHGGGNVFGPVPRDYRQYMPVRMRREALKSALLSKILDQQFKVIDTLSYETPKTKTFIDTLKALGLSKGSCLVSAREPNEALIKSVRNVERCRLVPARNLNAYDLIKYKTVLVTKDIVENIAEVVKA
jgi:large subunit ribosomal protein L4